MAETPAELRPSTPPRTKPSPSDAPERVFCRSSSRPSSSPAWRSSSAVQPMIGLCDDIVAGRVQAETNAVLMHVNRSFRRQDGCYPEKNLTRDRPLFNPLVGLLASALRIHVAAR